MRKLLLPLVAVSTLAAAPTVAQDFYGQVFGGANDISNLDFEGDIGGSPQSVGTDQDTGFNLGVAIGKSLPTLGSNLRGELELSYADSSVEGATFSGNGPAPEVGVAGDITTTRVFGNILYDIETNSKFTPYVGAGLGAAFTNVDFVYGPGVTLDDSSVDLTSQLILGTAYELSDTLSLVSDVRYIRDFGVTSDRLSGAGALTGVVEDDLESFNLNVGLRFSF